MSAPVTPTGPVAGTSRGRGRGSVPGSDDEGGEVAAAGRGRSRPRKKPGASGSAGSKGGKKRGRPTAAAAAAQDLEGFEVVETAAELKRRREKETEDQRVRRLQGERILQERLTTGQVSLLHWCV